MRNQVILCRFERLLDVAVLEESFLGAGAGGGDTLDLGPLVLLLGVWVFGRRFLLLGYVLIDITEHLLGGFGVVQVLADLRMIVKTYSECYATYFSMLSSKSSYSRMLISRLPRSILAKCTIQ